MTKDKRNGNGFVGHVRETDIEPYTALRWVGTMFKVAAIFLAVALVGQFIAGLRYEGTEALPALLGETARTAVLAVVLWGGGDLVRLMIQLGHDIRAERILLARLVHRTPQRPGWHASASGPETPQELRDAELGPDDELEAADLSDRASARSAA